MVNGRLLLCLSSLIVLCIGLPVLSLSHSLWVPTLEIWEHLAQTVLPKYITHSVILASACMFGTFLLGTATAWFCSLCHFRGRGFFRWALILPLAYPSYIIAYIYSGTLDYGGELYDLMRHYFSITTPLPVRSMEGAIAVITLSLYPYVYLLAYASWHSNHRHLLEVGRTLQATPWGNFLTVALPIARPAIVAAVVIVAMETLADYGTAHFFGVNTLSLGIMNTWFGLNSLATATQLSLVLLTFMIVLVIIEKNNRAQAHYTQDYAPDNESVYRLRGWHQIAAQLVCLIPILAGFVIPTLLLLHWSILHIDGTTWASYQTLLFNTLSVASLATLVIITYSLILAYTKRHHPGARWRGVIQVITSGYAIPGVVVAVALMNFHRVLQDYLGWVLSGGLLILVLAYAVRFLTLGFNTIDAGLERIPHELDDSARLLESSNTRILAKVHLPIMRASVMTALLFVFVDIIKELPITLALRPFNFNTFAVKTFELASDERIREIGLPALSMILIGLLPIVILARTMRIRKNRV